MKNITTEGASVFDSYIESLAAKPSRFIVHLDGRPTLAFRRTLDWDDMQAIRQAALNQTRAAISGNVHEAWKPFLGPDKTVVGRAIHLAKRHEGVIVDGEFVAQQWGELQFLMMAKADPHGFNALMDAVNDEIGVGWSVEDRDYFQPAAREAGEEPDGGTPNAGRTENLEQAS